MHSLLEFLDEESDEGVRLTRNFARLFFWLALIILLLAAVGIRLHLQGELDAYMPDIHPAPSWTEFLWGVAMVAALFLVLALAMRSAAKSLTVRRNRAIEKKRKSLEDQKRADLFSRLPAPTFVAER